MVWVDYSKNGFVDNTKINIRNYVIKNNSGSKKITNIILKINNKMHTLSRIKLVN
jgi:hypothetical protein